MGQKYIISYVVLTYDLIKLTAEDESDKLLLAAKKIRRATSTDFVISFVGDDFSRASSAYVGKMRQVLSIAVLTGLIFWVQSSPYMIANLQVKPQFN